MNNDETAPEVDSDEDRATALAAFLECEIGDLVTDSCNEHHFKHGSAEYVVLTDKEADELCKQYILDSLWAFNTSFIGSHTEPRLSVKAEKALQKAQQELCEDANDLVLALLKDVNSFVDDAMSMDGRGHFLAGYDSEENEAGNYFVYRTNW